MALNPNWKPSYPGEEPPVDYYAIPGQDFIHVRQLGGYGPNGGQDVGIGKRLPDGSINGDRNNDGGFGLSDFILRKKKPKKPVIIEGGQKKPVIIEGGQSQAPWNTKIPRTGGIKPTKEAFAAWQAQQATTPNYQRPRRRGSPLADLVNFPPIPSAE